MIPNDWRDRIACDLNLHHGAPCVRGTRIPVSILVASLADFNIDELLKQYRQLVREDIQSALYYAAEATRKSPLPSGIGDDFWHHYTLDELATRQGYRGPLAFNESFGSLADADWEGFDEFLEELRKPPDLKRD